MTLALPIALLTTAAATASLAAPAGPVPVPVPVKDKPAVTERNATAHGAWFGWAQDPEGGPDHYDFYVQRGNGARVKVNAPGTQALSGGIVGHSVYYAQQVGDRHPRIVRFDLRTGHRTALPPKVNRDGTAQGDVSVSGPWLLFSGYNTVMLYNRVTRERRIVESFGVTLNELYASQVNGSYVTFRNYAYADDPQTVIYRYNIKTKRTVRLPGGDFQTSPGVSSDGTVYYVRTDPNCSDPCTVELVRYPIGGPAEVLTTLLSSEFSPYDTFVKDRPDGSRVVFFSSHGDIYKVVDDQ